MKRVRISTWGASLRPPRNPRSLVQHVPNSSALPSLESRSCPSAACSSRHFSISRLVRQESPSPAMHVESVADHVLSHPQEDASKVRHNYSPHPAAAAKSAKLAALHARLSLPARLPVQTLARCLVDASADPRPEYNNSSLALVGQDLLGHHTAEWLICNYPRLPMTVIMAAQYGYVGPKTLDSMRREWGVEVAAAPGSEVDPGLLQFHRAVAGNAMSDDGLTRNKYVDGFGVKNKPVGTGRSNEEFNYRRGISSRIVYDDMFGDLQSGLQPAEDLADPNTPATQSSAGGVTQEDASATFVRALFGALYLHAGSATTKTFHSDHILSRHLPLHTLFIFKHPTRDLSRLCGREGFEPPVARLLSETGRHSRSPVFIVGVYSGEEKLGEGEGASLDEARVRAAANALRSWYLYSPPKEDIILPSQTEAKDGVTKWKPQMVDPGEVVT